MNVAMPLDSAHLAEVTATLASLAMHSPAGEKLELFLYGDKLPDAATREALNASLRDIHAKTHAKSQGGGLSLTWMRTTSSPDAADLEAFFQVLESFAGQKLLFVDPSLLFPQDTARLRDFFSDSHVLAGFADPEASWRGDAAYLPADAPYIHDSILWLNLDGVSAGETDAWREGARKNTLPGLDRRDALNRAFAGRIQALPPRWESACWTDGAVLRLTDAKARSKAPLALRLCGTSDPDHALGNTYRFFYLRKTFLRDSYSHWDRSRLALALSRALRRPRAAAKAIYEATARKTASAVISKVEYAHALSFRGIRDRLLELHAERAASFSTPLAGRESLCLTRSSGNAGYSAVRTLENERVLHGPYGVKDSYALLFGQRPRCFSDAGSIPEKSAAFFHNFRHSRIKKQIALLLAALAGKVDLSFVETGFLACITNVNETGIPFRFRRISAYLVDDKAFYYDALIPSRLEDYLNSEASALNAAEEQRAVRLISTLTSNRVSKYNYLSLTPPSGLDSPSPFPRVLVVDQSTKDASIARGMANERSFRDMLDAALAENPGAEILIKIHPDSLHKGRGSYFAHVRSAGRIRKLDEAVNPHILLERVDAVYTCTSTLGLEALLHGKTVHVFGMPVYAGWGLTQDRQTLSRRTRRLSLPELVHALYIAAPVYFDPLSGARVEVEEYIRSLLMLRDEYCALYGRAMMDGERETLRTIAVSTV